MRRFALLVLTLAACSKTDPLFCQQNPGATGCTDAGTGLDGGVDPTLDARLSFGSGAYAVKLTAPPVGPIDLTATSLIDTIGAMCSSTQLWVENIQPGACFIVATKITVGPGALIQVNGLRPLVLVATDQIVLTGKIDAAGHAGGEPGPGGPDGTCGTPGAPVNSTMGGGGGAGGSFMTAGGNGGGGNTAGANLGGVAVAALTSAPTILRAGCNGQTGATGGIGGLGGFAGGAVYLVAGTSMDLRTGTINVAGGGGGMATTKAGGGGGGTGGMIVLDAPSILTDSATRLVANGGGGSSGANGSVAGGDPDPATPMTAATGGAAVGGCGNSNGGGTGSTSGSGGIGSSVVASQCGGGGGGGGAGYIQTNVALQSGVFSPAPVVQ